MPGDERLFIQAIQVPGAIISRQRPDAAAQTPCGQRGVINVQAHARARAGNVKERQQRNDDETAVRDGRDCLADELFAQSSQCAANTAAKFQPVLTTRRKRPFRFSHQIKLTKLCPVSVPG